MFPYGYNYVADGYFLVRATAHLTLLVDGAPVGADPGCPALPDHQPPFAHPGRIRRPLVDVSGTPEEGD